MITGKTFRWPVSESAGTRSCELPPLGTGAILETSIILFLVEDEQLILMSLVDALLESGFAVVTASSGEEAVAMLNAQSGEGDYRALITDVNLGRGKLSGWDVARRAREIDDHLPVIYMTGDSAHDWGSKGVPNSILVTKPFASMQIVTAVS